MPGILKKNKIVFSSETLHREVEKSIEDYSLLQDIKCQRMLKNQRQEMKRRGRRKDTKILCCV